MEAGRRRRLGKLVSGGAIDLVPLWAGEFDFAGGGDFLDSSGVSCAEDRLDFGRVALDPGDGEASLRDAVFGADFVHHLVQLFELRIVDEGALEEAELEGRPGLNRDLFESAVLEDAAVAVDSVVPLHVDRDAVVDHSGVHDAELELVGDDRHGERRLEQFHLGRVEVAHAKVTDFALGFELDEGLGDLFGLHQGVGAVEEKTVNVVGVEAGENFVDGLENIFFAEVEKAISDATFALEDDLVSLDSEALCGGGEDLFALATAVDVGVVEEVNSFVEGGFDEVVEVGRCHSADSHAAEGHFGGFDVGSADLNSLHGVYATCFLGAGRWGLEFTGFGGPKFGIHW